MTYATTTTPVTTGERIQTIDIIRGVALFGIIIINFTVDGTQGPQAGWTDFGDQTVYWGVKFLLDDRFQSMYCFLFGLGFAIQMQRASEKNSPFVTKYLRRMLALFLVASLMHMFFTWSYNVLPFYAIIGVWLLLFWKIPTKFLPLLAIFFFLLPFTINTVEKVNKSTQPEGEVKKVVAVDTTFLDQYAGVYQVEQNINVIFFRKGDSLIGEGPTKHFALLPFSDSQFFRKDIEQHYTFMKDSTGDITQLKVVFVPTGFSRVFKKIQVDIQVALKRQIEQRPQALKGVFVVRTYRQYIKNNFDLYWSYFKTFPWQNFLWKGDYEVGYILVLFLLGMYAGRKKIFTDVSSNKKLLKKIFIWGISIGAPIVIFRIGLEMRDYKSPVIYPPVRNAMLTQTWNLGIIILSLAYIAGLTLLLENDNWKKRLSFFGTVGRLGLTNYSLHLLATLLIFENVDLFLGLNGKIGHVYRLLIAIAVYALLYFFSRWWLSHFKIGPFEWLWRSITYWKWQPMREKEAFQISTNTV